MKKTVIFLLCLLLVISIVHISVFASSDEGSKGSLVLPEDSTRFLVADVNDPYNRNEDIYDWEDGVLYIGDCLVKANPEEIGEEYVVHPGTRIIAQGAFRDCTSLKNVNIPDTVKFVGSEVFNGTAMYNDERNWKNGLFIVSDKYLIKVSGDVVECEIPEGITFIAEDAFEYPIDTNSLKKITVPKSIKAFSWSSFGKVKDSVKVYYHGTLSDFIRITDFDWDCINLYTSDYFLKIWVIVGFSAVLLSGIVFMVIYNYSWAKRKADVKLECRNGGIEDDG